MKALPITYVNINSQTDEPYNNLSNYQIMKKALDVCDPKSILVCDSHYLTLAGIIFIFFFIILLLLLFFVVSMI
jgi:hypothetical protein